MAAAYSEPYKELEEERCRLCLEGEYDGPLVQPCACRGSIKWIHEHCLERWRRTSPREDAAYCCGECRGYYRDALSIRAPECTATGRANEWAGHMPHLGHPRAGAASPGHVRRG
eukprot:scaffold11462_cov68-Phaeocystis_antarctica.AAC.2